MCYRVCGVIFFSTFRVVPLNHTTQTENTHTHDYSTDDDNVILLLYYTHARVITVQRLVADDRVRRQRPHAVQHADVVRVLVQNVLVVVERGRVDGRRGHLFVLHHLHGEQMISGL